jgi:hypothetical protein
MNTKQIVFEAMLAQAVKQVASHPGTIEEAIAAVALDLELTNEERNALAERAKKSSKLVMEPVEEAEPADAEPMQAPVVSGNAMHFASEDDLDSAAGMLMYKSVPWKSKSKDGGEYLVEFDDADTLKEAMGVLKRKFDFVEHGKRRVGVVEFDNLADYGKVMEFMKKQGMMIESADMGPLDEDIDLQEQMNEELGGSVGARSYAAKPKGLAGEFNVVEDSAARAVVVRKRWK